MAALCCLVYLCQTAAPAFAQTVNLAVANVERLPNGSARLALAFSSGPPTYQVDGIGTTTLTVTFIGTAPAPDTPTAIAAVGPIVTGQISAAGTATTIVLHVREPAMLQVTAGPRQTLIVDIVSVSAPAPGAAARPDLLAEGVVAASGIVTKRVPLKYADPSEVLVLLSSILIVPNEPLKTQAPAPADNSDARPIIGVRGSGFGISTSPAATFAGERTQEIAGQRLNDAIAVDRRLNAVILTGTAAQIARYEAAISEVDIPQRGVMLQTEMVELTDTAATDLGIDFTGGGGGPIGAITATISSATGAATATSGQASLQAAIYAQVQKGNGRILSAPSIFALDGQPASILTGAALPILTSVAVSGANAIQQQVQYVNVGVNLQIQARSTPEGVVIAQIYSTVSTVTRYTATYPNIAQREASTTITVKNGESFVIGGLLQKSELVSFSKIPILGDLPLIGGLFRVRHGSSSTDNLYIVVTPRIIESGAPPR